MLVHPIREWFRMTIITRKYTLEFLILLNQTQSKHIPNIFDSFVPSQFMLKYVDVNCIISDLRVPVRGQFPDTSISLDHTWRSGSISIFRML
jgi:hypothetical protein